MKLDRFFYMKFHQETVEYIHFSTSFDEMVSKHGQTLLFYTFKKIWVVAGFS
jgi:hypothetical protein